MSNTRELNKYLKKTSKKYPGHLIHIPAEEWPEITHRSKKLIDVMRSNRFLVQIYSEESPCVVRLSTCKTEMFGSSWKDGITWEELMQIKRECGYEDRDAVEIYPNDNDIVNVSNMRHLFVMKEPLPFAWRNETW